MFDNSKVICLYRYISWAWQISSIMTGLANKPEFIKQNSLVKQLEEVKYIAVGYSEIIMSDDCIWWEEKAEHESSLIYVLHSVTLHSTSVPLSYIPIRGDILSCILFTQQWWAAGLFRQSEVTSTRKVIKIYLT